MNILYTLYFIFLGLCLGSFANAMIYRIPKRMMSEFKREAQEILELPIEEPIVINKRSACPSCGTQLRWFHNIPVVSWLALKGQSHCCQKPISPRYIINEIIGGFMGYGAYLFAGGDLITAFFILTMALMTMILFWIDMDHFLLPDRVLILWLILACVGLLYPNIFGHTTLPSFLPDPSAALEGFFWGFFSLWSINTVYKLLRGHDGMGMGDVKLFAIMGMLLTAYKLPIAILIASFSTIIIVIFARLFGYKNSMVPFGPGLLFGFWITFILTHLHYI